jgi:predicted  nucleic acid-binding Zn-ribbon protein
VYRFTTTGGEISESYAELLERLESTKRTLRNAMEFINDDRHLTDEGIAAREALLEEIETIEQNLEAIRQELGLELATTPKLHRYDGEQDGPVLVVYRIIGSGYEKGP